MTPIPLGILDFPTGAAGAYDLLETVEPTTNPTNITFTGLGSYSDYKHLQIRFMAQTSSTFAAVTDNLIVRCNGTGASDLVYTTHRLYGQGSSVASTNIATDVNQIYIQDGITRAPNGSVFGGGIMDILDFSNANKTTTLRTFTGAIPTGGTSFVALHSALFKQTSALTSIDFFESGGDTFQTGTRFSLYGVK